MQHPALPAARPVRSGDRLRTAATRHQAIPATGWPTSLTKDAPMRIPRERIPAKIDVPGAVARQVGDFGDATGFGKMAGEWFSLGAGTDIQPLLKGLQDDACQSPHWGYMLAGELVVTYTDGSTDTCREHDLFYWPPGHSVRVVKDAEVILFSPQHEHAAVMEHMLDKMQG
jgi:hypothetical protein